MPQPLARIELTNFTVFAELAVDLSPGINVLIGVNGTGKTHLMKLLYDVCVVSGTDTPVAQKLVRDFMPDGAALGRLVRRRRGSSQASVKLVRGAEKVDLTFSNHATEARHLTVQGSNGWGAARTGCVYIPAKEVLSNAPGFRSLYSAREIAFEELYVDLIDRALLPPEREQETPEDGRRAQMLGSLQKILGGPIEHTDERFYLKQGGRIEFPLVAEGLKKLALLWVLLQNGTLGEGTLLFWDEPEANLNPSMLKSTVKILLELRRMGVQIFLATHNYVVLKELQLESLADDAVVYHALSRQTNGSVSCSSTDDADLIEPNAVLQAFDSIYDREIQRFALGTKR